MSYLPNISFYTFLIVIIYEIKRKSKKIIGKVQKKEGKVQKFQDNRKIKTTRKKQELRKLMLQVS